MKIIRLTIFIATLILSSSAIPNSHAQTIWNIGVLVDGDEQAISDFEGEAPVSKNTTTHRASVTVVKDVPKDGARFAAKTVVDKTAGATEHFGTGFSVEDSDLSGAGEIRFWIKTNIESVFNFQVHSDGDGASVFRFSTVGSNAKTWKLISAPAVRLLFRHGQATPPIGRRLTSGRSLHSAVALTTAKPSSSTAWLAPESSVKPLPRND